MIFFQQGHVKQKMGFESILNWTITIYLSNNGEWSKLLIPDVFFTSSVVWDVNDVKLKFTYISQMLYHHFPCFIFMRFENGKQIKSKWLWTSLFDLRL
jgi:hypothetical protein